MIKLITHLIFNTKSIKKEIKMFAETIHDKKILEIGSGKNTAYKYFDRTNDYENSDKNYSISLDVTKMSYFQKYDLIMCINVLDDIFEYQLAVDNMYDALKKPGEIFLIVNGFYPLHDLPHDYFRFTEYSLKKIFAKFKYVEIKYIGLKRFPSYYVLKAIK